MPTAGAFLLSLPLGGGVPFPRRAHPSLAAMFRLQAAMLMADGDLINARSLRRRARQLEIRRAAAELADGTKLVIGTVGHA